MIYRVETRRIMINKITRQGISTKWATYKEYKSKYYAMQACLRLAISSPSQSNYFYIITQTQIVIKEE